MLSSFFMIPPTLMPYLDIMLLRPAEPADAMAVARVHVRSWQAAYSTLLPAEYLDQLRPEHRGQTYDFATADPRKPQTIVAVEAGSLCGAEAHLDTTRRLSRRTEVRLPPTRSRALQPVQTQPTKPLRGGSWNPPQSSAADNTGAWPGSHLSTAWSIF